MQLIIHHLDLSQVMGAVETKIEGHGSLGNGGKPFDAAAAAYFGAYYLQCFCWPANSI